MTRIELPKDAIGKINSMDFCSYVAVEKQYLDKALNGLSKNKIKGKYFRVFEK
ncbi:DbpA RNA binding domain-containing protein [Malaciobacter pacificus]|uniref:DbpA RNA binding domain-containing protein n=1 Tax=Malaciobacter pacificus TaxID=1080223 RepID=UPI0035306E5B